MAYDSNRGRDLPRAPKIKALKNPHDPAAEQIKRMKKRARIEKALAKAVHLHGFDSLMSPGIVMTDKMREKEFKLVIQALAMDLPVHSRLLEFHNLEDEPNPPVPVLDEPEIPF